MIITNFLPLIISFLASLILVPVARWVSFRSGHVALPRGDRWHRKPTPKLGGVGMFVAFAISLLIIFFTNADKNILIGRWSILISIVLMFSVGLYDEFKPINPPIKLTFQIIAATIVIFFGNNIIKFFPWPIANILLTYLWLVGITNAINLLDNMDGLAGGVALITSGFLSLFFWRSGHYDLLTITFALAGSILGFLIFNFPPAKIFMGDSGSMFLGFSLAALAIARRTQASNIFAIIGVPTLIFLLPIIDTGLVTITRILRGQSPAIGGTDHTSHRLVAFGLSERQAVLVLYGIAIISGLTSIGLDALNYNLSLVFIPILLIILSLFVAYLSRIKIVTAQENQTNSFTRWIVALTYKRRVFEIIFDLVLIGVSYYLGFWTSYGFDMTKVSMNLFLQSWPIALGITYASFFIMGVYRGVWKYIGINDLVRYIGAAVLSAGISWGVAKLAFPNQPYTGDVFLLFFLFLLISLSGSRSSFLLFERVYNRQIQATNSENILLFGADDAGEIALRWILRNPTIGYSVVGFLDDDSLKWGNNIHGVNIIGNSDNLDHFIEEKHITGVIATTNNLLNSPSGEKLLSTCRDKGVWIRVLRLEFELHE